MLRTTTIERHFAFFMLCFVLMLPTYAQENGPTKEQTVEYIKSWFSEFETVVRTEGQPPRKREGQFKVSFNDCHMFIEWSHYAFNGSFSHKIIYEFDVKNIESLGIAHSTPNEGHQYSIIFNSINKRPLIKETTNTGEKYVPSFWLSVYRGPNQQDVEESKIFKAFNHLRKLCGAPDPISFD